MSPDSAKRPFSTRIAANHAPLNPDSLSDGVLGGQPAQGSDGGSVTSMPASGM